MADFNDFAKKMQRRSEQFDGNVTKAMRLAALRALQVAVSATPVDTGRARGGWVVSLGEPFSFVPNIDDRVGGSTVSRGAAVIDQYTIDRGELISLFNNVSYIGALDRGTSAQAPLGMSRLAAQAALDLLRTLKVLARGN